MFFYAEHSIKMNPHIPSGLLPMMMPQQIGGQQYMMAVRLPSGGIPAAAAAQPYVAAGVPGVQGLQVIKPLLYKC